MNGSPRSSTRCKPPRRSEHPPIAHSPRLPVAQSYGQYFLQYFAVLLCNRPSLSFSLRAVLLLLRVVPFQASITQKPPCSNDFRSEVRVETLPVAKEALLVTKRVRHQKGCCAWSTHAQHPWSDLRLSQRTFRVDSPRARQLDSNIPPPGGHILGYCRMAMHTKSRMKRTETIQTIGCTSLAFLRHTLTMQYVMKPAAMP